MRWKKGAVINEDFFICEPQNVPYSYNVNM